MFASTILTLGLVIAAPAPKEGKVEPGKLEGEWVVEKYVQGGVPEAKRSGMHMSFANDKVTVQEEKGPAIGYKADPKASPAAIELLAGKETIPGIYKIEGDTLTICFPKGGKGVRPTKFESPENSEYVLMVLKRDKK
jgi:uncharacterized protein (TIGR03067 family)